MDNGMPALQTKDPVMAVVLVRQEEHSRAIVDHEARLRPLEKFKSQVLSLAFIGAAVGAALINFLFQRFGAL
jgi:hypothetical protein